MIFQSIYRNGATITPSEYANVVGRAGRAYVDLDGLTVLPIFETGPTRWRRQRDYSQLREQAKNRQLESGLLELIKELAQHLSNATGHDCDELTEHVLNREVDWLPDSVNDQDERRTIESHLADLDTTILATVDDLGCTSAELADALDDALRNSLWQRRLRQLDPGQQALQSAILQARAKWIWDRTETPQRRGFFSAGIGYEAGAFLDANISELFAALSSADDRLHRGDVPAAITSITELAGYLYAVHPFAVKHLPENWDDLLEGWINGIPLSDVFQSQSDEEVNFIQQGIVYQLVWGVEAVRVHAIARGVENATDVSNRVSMALTYGVPSLSAALVIEAGLPSRKMAMDVVNAFDAHFGDRDGLAMWLRPVLRKMSKQAIWFDPPTLWLW